MRTHIVSASAGSGKTHRLARELNEALSRAVGRVLPENVLATTFTNKAAAELQRRARGHLLASGRPEDAQRLTAARIGTVNAVCGRLVSDFAFELGLPPEQRVLDEQAAKVALRRALSAVISVEESQELAELHERLPFFEALDAVRSVIEMARANRIDATVLASCARRSQAEIGSHLDDPRRSADELNATLREALEEFERGIDPAYDKTNDTGEALARVGKNLARLRAGRTVIWDEWAALAKLKVGAKSRPQVKAVHEATERYLEHPSFRADLERISELVFDLAGRGLRAYSEHKRAAGVVDFGDQEAWALELLERADVRERMRGELGLVLVDEFQDTSPLQLAIFLHLAELAEQSLWVGDQKQSIFAFRGSDPELMESAIESLLGGEELETLAHSWRSRPELVHLTSDVFAAAFARHGLPESRVRLAPAPELAEEPSGLGPIVERWRLDAKNQAQDAGALAAAVGLLLADETACVRDGASGAVRRVQPADVAILCRQNKAATAVAAALADAGLRAVVPRDGLLATPEGQLALAGLCLWADPGDRLAAATIARLAELPADGDRWLETALESPNAQAFFDMPRARRLLSRRLDLLTAGPGDVLDAVLEALDVRRLCADWGNTAQRLANLDALRSHAVVFAEASLSDGGGATVTDLVIHLKSLLDDGLDSQAMGAAHDAVVVSTWHAAKGLEWPIVVLFQLDAENDPSVFGVSVERDERPFDFRQPLEGRWIRLWPAIFHPSRAHTTLQDRLNAASITQRIRARREYEELRLLYVGWTRARDRVVLAGRPTRLLDGILRHLAGVDGVCLIDDNEDGHSVWAGRKVKVERRAAAAGAAVPLPIQPGRIYAASDPRAHPAAWAQPSAATATGAAEIAERLGERLDLRGTYEDRCLGEVLHGFLASDDRQMERSERLRSAQGLLDRWGLSANLAAGELLEASDRLWAWIARRWPGARCRREWSVRERLPDGTVLQGRVDLVVEAGTHLVIVDHKSFPGGMEDALERAAGFAGQLEAYAGGMLRSIPGAGTVESFVHLPVSGLVVAVFRETAVRLLASSAE